MIKGFHHVAYHAIDFDETVKFYKVGLGLEISHSWGEKGQRAVMISTNDNSFIEVFENGQKDIGTGRLLHLALKVDDCNEMTEKAVLAGAQITMNPTDIKLDSSKGEMNIRISFVKYKNDEVIEFYQDMD